MDSKLSKISQTKDQFQDIEDAQGVSRSKQMGEV
jgi:hypothetical protein